MQKYIKSPVCVAVKDLLLKLYGCITLLPYVLGESGDADIFKEKDDNSDIDIDDNSSASGYSESKSYKRQTCCLKSSPRIL